MKLSVRYALVAALLFAMRPAFADDAITSVTSPTASYQYSEDFNSGVLTNGGILSPIVSYQYPDNFSTEFLTNGGIQSPIISFQYVENFSAVALTNGGIISPIASYQYYEWPSNAILNLQSSPVVSYYYQTGGSSGQLVISGSVTDANGAALSGATVSAMIYQTPAAQASTDANGNYQMSMLGGDVYSLEAWASSYATSLRVFTLNANTAIQNFQLNLIPTAPATVQVDRQPTVAYTFGPMGSSLKIFDGVKFVPICDKNTPATNVMTIVLTHGWIPLDPLTLAPYFATNGIDDWPTTLAANLCAHGVGTNVANIVAWDWKMAAAGIDAPQLNTPGQGTALGTNLLAALGASYSQPIHFLGHSLGTMVNAGAVNFLHGDQIPSSHSSISPTPWLPGIGPPIHLTLFDEAAEATSDSAGAQFFFDGNTVSQNVPSTLFSIDTDTALTWSPPLPVRFTWADNYVSLVGFYHQNAANVLLNRSGVADLHLIAAHGYSQQWYNETISNPSDPNNPLGFQISFESDVKNNESLQNIPPSGLSDAYIQFSLTAPNDEFALSPIPPEIGSLVVSSYGMAASTIVHKLEGPAEFLGDAEANFEDAAHWAGQNLSSGFNYVANAATQGGQKVVNVINSESALRISLTTGPYLAVQQFSTKKASPSPAGLTSSSNTPPMIWLPITFPANATSMAFDFILSGDPAADALVCGIGSSNLFSLEAKYVPTNTISTSGLINVSAWANTTNKLFFGFLGGTSTNATFQIGNIRFFSLGAPALTIQLVNGSAVLSWPISANGYVLETTHDLNISNSWCALTNAATIVNNSYTTTNQISESPQFFRLKLQQ